LQKRYSIREVPDGGGKIDYEKALNPRQAEAVLHGDGPLLVIAGAGTGKTRTLIYRVARLVELGHSPASVLLLTFTRRAAEEMLRAVPGIELVDLGQPAVGLMANYFRALPEYRNQLYRAELEAAREAGVDALVAVYHADHRDLCAHEGEYPFRIINLLEIVGESMGLEQADNFKRLKLMQDAEAIVEDCRDLIEAHGMDIDEVRRTVETAMLAEQPLPLGGARA